MADLKVAILGRPDTWYTRAIQRALKNRGVQAPCFPVTSMQGRIGCGARVSAMDESLDEYQAVIVRAIPGGSLEQIIYRMDILHRLQNLGVRVINPPWSIERGVDKYYTLTLMQDAGLPTPRTLITERFEDALAGFEELGGDVVVKPLFGSEGRGMVRVCDQDSAYRVFRALELGRYVYYLQEFLPHQNKDLRVFVLGGEVQAAMVRQGRSWKSNICQGARGHEIQPDRALIDLSLRAAQALQADYAGVDLLPLPGGAYSLIEVNTIPGWRGLKKATGFDGAAHLADYVLEQIQCRP